MRIQEDALGRHQDRLGLGVMLGTLLLGRRGKVQLTFRHQLSGRGAWVVVIDEVLGAFVLGRQIELDCLSLVTTLLQAAVVEWVRNGLVLGAPSPHDATWTGRVAGSGRTRTAIGVDATGRPQGRCAAAVTKAVVVAPPLGNLGQVVHDKFCRLGLSGATFAG